MHDDFITLINNPALNVEDPVLRQRLRTLADYEQQHDDAVATLADAAKDREHQGVLNVLQARIKHVDELCIAAKAKVLFTAEALLGEAA